MITKFKKYLKSFESEIFEQYVNINQKEFILYRGTDYNLPFYNTTNIFLSTDKNFAKDYGKNIFQVTIKPNKIFDSLNDDYMKMLFVWSKNGIYDKFHEQKYKTFEDLNELYPGWDSDTWDIIEEYLYLIPNEFDTILITEGGTVNFIVRDESIIKKTKKL